MQQQIHEIHNHLNFFRVSKPFGFRRATNLYQSTGIKLSKVTFCKNLATTGAFLACGDGRGAAHQRVQRRPRKNDEECEGFTICYVPQALIPYEP